MFEHFTFGTHAPAQYLQDVSPSPTDTTFPSSIPPPSSCPSHDAEMTSVHASINDLMRRLRGQSLLPREDVAYQTEWIPSTPGLDTDDDTMSSTSSRGNSAASLPIINVARSPSGGSIACKRLQRQLNVQLQSSNSHARDVKTLVEDMIVTNSQCVLHKSTSSQLSLTASAPSQAGRLDNPVSDEVVDPMVFDECLPEPDENANEGYQEGQELPFNSEFVYRRASGAAGGIRKSHLVELARGADYMVIGGRLLVKSAPRMRRRRKNRPPRVS